MSSVVVHGSEENNNFFTNLVYIYAFSRRFNGKRLTNELQMVTAFSDKYLL